MADSELYNADELVAPEWMDKQFFENILKESRNDKSIIVESIDIRPGSKKGDHYGSVMYRALVNYNKEGSSEKLSQSMIIKIMPFAEGSKKEMMEATGIGKTLFEVEIDTYSKALPKIEAALRAAGDNTEIVGKCFYTAVEPELILIFEDLTIDNYKAIDKWGGDWELGKKSLEKLAKWHAVTFKSSVEGDEDFKKFNVTLFNDEQALQMPMFRDGFKNFFDMLQSTPEFSEYVPIFEKIMANNPLQKATNIFKAYKNGDPAHLYVLNHGDFHIKNVMYTEKDDGKVDDVKLVDFQLSFWGPAVIDLTYMLYMLIDGESRLNRRNEIIHHYFTCFTETLKQLKFAGEFPKLTDLYKDFLTYKDFELMMLTTMLPFMTAFKTETVDLEQAMANEDVIRGFYNNPEYLKFLRKALPEFLYRGYLD